MAISARSVVATTATNQSTSDQSISDQSASNQSSALDEELKWLQAEAVVYSVSKHKQKVADTAAAVYVISSEDIRRSGVTSIPEALRMAPGINVARINANTWAITARGFNGLAANKLLVLIDGRSIYHPIFSGTIWRTQDVMLEDVERIEVIRGPGAAMWGANAVNGIINVITKHAKKTQGLLVSVGSGSEDQGIGSFRYGGKLGDSTTYRSYVKYAKHNSSVFSTGANARDKWSNLQGGFRMDGDITASDSFTLHGAIYTGKAGGVQTVVAPISPYTLTQDVGEAFTGGDLQGRWKHIYSDTSDMSLQIYFDQQNNQTHYTGFGQTLTSAVRTYDAEFQHRFQLGERHNIIWGSEFRYVSDHIGNTLHISFNPASRAYRTYSGFAQDDITLLANRIHFIFGTKYSHNDFSGTEIQPDVRIIWTPNSIHTFWAAVSRAVHTPTRFDQNLQALYIAQMPPVKTIRTFIALQGNKNQTSEQLIAYELGYRMHPSASFALDVTTFYNRYTKLASNRLGTPFLQTALATPHLVIPIVTTNNMRGHTYGFEASAQWKALDWWRLKATYSWLSIQIQSGAGSIAGISSAAGQSPKHQASLRSSMDLSNNLELDTWVYYVDKLPALQINSYVSLGVRIGWKPVKNIELSITGKNLLDNRHPEYKEVALTRSVSEVERSVYANIQLKY